MTSDLLLGIWMIVLAVLHCHNAFVLLTKKVGFMRFVYFVEGVVFVTLSLLVARRGGLPAIIGCSIVCSSVFSGAYGVRRISRYFNFPLREVCWDWLRPMTKMLLFYLPLAALVWWALLPLPSTMRLVCNAILAGSAGLYLFLRFGLPPSIQTEIIQHTPLLAQSLLKRICGRAYSLRMTGGLLKLRTKCQTSHDSGLRGEGSNNAVAHGGFLR